MVHALQTALALVVATQDRLVESDRPAALKLVMVATQELYDRHGGTDLG